MKPTIAEVLQEIIIAARDNKEFDLVLKNCRVTAFGTPTDTCQLSMIMADVKFVEDGTTAIVSVVPTDVGIENVRSVN